MAQTCKYQRTEHITNDHVALAKEKSYFAKYPYI